MNTLQHEGFLRGPGLLQLETIQKCFDIINQEPKFKAHKKKVTDFCSEGKLSTIVRVLFFDSKGNQNWPIVILYGFTEENCKIAHAAVIKDYTGQNLDLKLTIRNSLSGEKVFGEEIESGELKIEGKITTKNNQWNLGHENCHYFAFL